MKSLVGKLDRKVESIEEAILVANEAAAALHKQLTGAFRQVAGDDDEVFAAFCEAAKMSPEPEKEEVDLVAIREQAISELYEGEAREGEDLEQFKARVEYAVQNAVSDARKASMIEEELLASDLGQRWIETSRELWLEMSLKFSDVFERGAEMRYNADIASGVLNLGKKINRNASSAGKSDEEHTFVRSGVYEGTAQSCRWTLTANDELTLVVEGEGKNGEKVYVEQCGVNGEVTVNALKTAALAELIGPGLATPSSNLSVNKLLPDLKANYVELLPEAWNASEYVKLQPEKEEVAA